MPRRHTTEERVFIVKNYYESGNYREVVRRFEDRFGRPIDRKSIPSLIKRFETTGRVDEDGHGRQSNEKHDEQIAAVASAINEMGDNFSIRKASANLDIPKSSVHRILKIDLGLKSYHYSLHQELNEDDPDRRLNFCEDFLTLLENDDQFITKIVWTDEAKFFLNGTVNRHNSVYWSNHNEHRLGTKSMDQRGVTVWAGISYRGVTAPRFFRETVKGENYLSMLQDALPNIIELGSIFMQDGAPAHYYRPVINYLNSNFPNRWIGRRGNLLEWPPRSPDFTPCDFFLWGHLKEIVYKSHPQSLGELEDSIRTAFSGLNGRLCRKVCTEAVERRIRLCVQENGEHIENKL